MNNSIETGLSTDTLKNVLGEQIARYFFPSEVVNPLTEEEISFLEKKLLELAGVKNMGEFLQTVAPQTAIVTFIAGAGSRWVKSLEENPDLKARYEIVEDQPRALAKVEDLCFLGEKLLVPIGAYNLLAVSGFGTQIIVYGGASDEEAERNRRLIESEIVIKISQFGEPVFIRQKIHPGQQKPLGHGDAWLQIMESDEGKQALEGKRYVITNFGGDPNSYRTALLSLLAMYVLDKNNLNIGVLIPTAISSDPQYGIFIDSTGLPAGVSHKKEGIKSSEETRPTTQTNVGIRVYRINQLIQTAQLYENLYRQIAEGNSAVSYPNGELKLDHFDAAIMGSHQALSLPIADIGEIQASVKTVGGLMPFAEAMKKILERDNEFRKRHSLSTI